MRIFKVFISTLLLLMGMGGSPAFAQGSPSIPNGSERFARGEKVVIPVTAANCENLTAFSFEVSLPDCVTGIDSITPGDMLTSGHTLFSNKNEDNYYVACLSLTSSVFTAGSGVLCYLYLHISDDIDRDKFRVGINNVEFSSVLAEPFHPEDSYVDVQGFFTIQTYRVEYYIDGELDSFDSIDACSPIVPADVPVKEGYTFSGWSEIPAVMPDGNVIVTGTFTINSYNLIYKVDNEVYKTLTKVYGSSLTAEAAPQKEGYTFSGWSGLPSTMPARDVTVIGSFTVNSYTLSVVYDGKEVFSAQIAYGMSLAQYIEILKQRGLYQSEWDEYLIYIEDKFGDIANITMPAYDYTLNVTPSAVKPVLTDGNKGLFDLMGRPIENDDLSTLPKGIYILDGRKYIVK